MDHPTIMFAMGLFGLVGLCATSAAALRGWRDWLALKRAELFGESQAMAPGHRSGLEIAELKERVRRLEAIANGIEA